jgi:hypothetical protein
MPHYYFDTSDEDMTVVDTEGLDYPDDDQAIAEATRGLGDLVREMICAGRTSRASVTVRTDSGVPIFSMASTTVSVCVSACKFDPVRRGIGVQL